MRGSVKSHHSTNANAPTNRTSAMSTRRRRTTPDADSRFAITRRFATTCALGVTLVRPHVGAPGLRGRVLRVRVRAEADRDGVVRGHPGVPVADLRFDTV